VYSIALCTLEKTTNPRFALVLLKKYLEKYLEKNSYTRFF
jgi:hypothetical protein